MNHATVLVILASVIAPFHALAASSQDAPVTVPLMPEKIWAAPGFDSNDNSQIVLTGMLPNTCYRSGPAAKVRVDKLAKKIYVSNEAYLYEGEACLMMQVPFSKVVDIGALPPGKFAVVAEDAGGDARQLTTLPVAVARSSDPDEQTYAVVESASVILGGRTRSLMLSGYLTGGCMKLQEIQVLTRRKGVIEVLPIAKVNHIDSCTFQLIRWERRIELDTSWTGEALLHVRSLNGNALNVMTRL